VVLCGAKVVYKMYFIRNKKKFDNLNNNKIRKLNAHLIMFYWIALPDDGMMSRVSQGLTQG